MVLPIQDCRARLPSGVYDLARRMGARADPAGHKVRLTQRGRLKNLGASGWLKFSAIETLQINHCGFEWDAHAGPLGFLRIRDTLEYGRGRLAVTAVGIFVVSEPSLSAALTRAQLQRYLAELAWAPDGIFCNRNLRWRQDGLERFIVCTGREATTSEVVLSLNGDGLIETAMCENRPRAVGDHFVPTQWQIRFFDYRRIEGLLIPSRGEAGWVLEGKSDICWQGEIATWHSVTDTGD